MSRCVRESKSFFFRAIAFCGLLCWPFFATCGSSAHSLPLRSSHRLLGNQRVLLQQSHGVHGVSLQSHKHKPKPRPGDDDALSVPCGAPSSRSASPLAPSFAPAGASQTSLPPASPSLSPSPSPSALPAIVRTTSPSIGSPSGASNGAVPSQSTDPITGTPSLSLAPSCGSIGGDGDGNGSSTCADGVTVPTVSPSLSPSSHIVSQAPSTSAVTLSPSLLQPSSLSLSPSVTESPSVGNENSDSGGGSLWDEEWLWVVRQKYTFTMRNNSVYSRM